MGRGPKKHQKRLSAPKHWLLDKLSGLYAPKASPGPHKLRDCMPLVVFIRNRYVGIESGRNMARNFRPAILTNNLHAD
jgi:small subunit ribosomal protein S4e